MKTLLLMAALSPAMPANAAELTCDFGHAAFKRSDGATIVAKESIPTPEGSAEGLVFAEGWFEARGIDGVVGFAVWAGNCGGPGCVLVVPKDAAGKDVTEGGGALTPDGQDAWPGAPDDVAPSFIQIDGFGTFYRECRPVAH